MNTEWTNSFVIFPEHANHMSPIIFGGKFMAELDLTAAKCVRRFLYDSDIKSSVTYKADFTFLKPTYVADLIVMVANVVGTGEKSISVKVKAFREKNSSIREQVAEANFVFITAILEPDNINSKPEFLPYAKHGLKI